MPPDDSLSAAFLPRQRAALFVDGHRPHLAARAAEVREVLERQLDVVSVVDELTGACPPEALAADLAVVCGGDGSILRTARLLGRDQIPVLGVNLGRLGFLAAIEPDLLDDVLPLVVAGRYRVVRHVMLECTVLRDGKELSRTLGLNEAAMLAGEPFAMLDVQLFVDGELATTYSCDGLIVSTPVGSTAHNLAAGGPILRKDLQAIVVSPICPHTLTNRPVVDSADRVYELAAPAPNAGAALVVDGQVIHRPQPNDRFRIERSDAEFQLIEVEGRGYYRTLREKLGWGGRLHLREG